MKAGVTGRCLVLCLMSLATWAWAEAQKRAGPPVWENTGLSVMVDAAGPGAGLCDTEEEIRLGLQYGAVDPAWQREAGRYLEEMKRTNPRMARFVQGQGYLLLNRTGPTVVAPLPPFSNVVLYARGALPGLVAWRTNQIAAGRLTEVHFSAAELSPGNGKAISLRSRLVLEETSIPVAGAKIRVSGTCFNTNTVTDSGGSFTLTAVPTDRLLTWDIEAADTATPARYSFSIRRVLWVNSDQDVRAMNWRIPASRELVVRLDGEPALKSTGYPLFGVDALQSNGTWRFRKVLRAVVSKARVALVQSQPGLLRARIHEGFFLARYSEPVEFGPDDFRKETVLLPAPFPRDRVVVRVDDEKGRPVANASVSFASLSPGQDPLELTTDARGCVSIGPLNVSSVDVFVESPRGSFSGPLTIPEEGEPAVLRVKPDASPER